VPTAALPRIVVAAVLVLVAVFVGVVAAIVPAVGVLVSVVRIVPRRTGGTVVTAPSTTRTRGAMVVVLPATRGAGGALVVVVLAAGGTAVVVAAPVPRGASDTRGALVARLRRRAARGVPAAAAGHEKDRRTHRKTMDRFHGR
jgi:hypothetical protein